MSARRSFLFCLACLSANVHAGTPDPSLIGCWRAAKIVLHARDGSKIEDTSGRCMLRFKEDALESTCTTASGIVKVTYTYRIVRPGFYETRMVTSTFKTDLIGATREYEYHVDGDRLVTVTKPPASAAPNPGIAVRVEAESTRSACP